jgi:hypothetical protein
MAVGSPSQVLRLHPSSHPGQPEIAAGTYLLEAFVASPTQRQVESFEDDFDTARHYLVDFNPGGHEPDFLQHPRGMSGGAWLLPPDVTKNEIWDGSRVALVGIETAWFSRSRLLKVVRIERLIALLEKTTSW